MRSTGTSRRLQPGILTLRAREVFLQGVMLKLRFTGSEGVGVRGRLF